MGLFNGVVIDKSIQFNQVETQRGNISILDRITVDLCRARVKNGFQQGIAKTFILAGEGDEVGVWIDVPKGIVFLPIIPTAVRADKVFQ